MGESPGEVATNSRAAQWRIENLPAGSSLTSDPFPIGSWSWILSVENDRKTTIRLFPRNAFEIGIPIASFIIRVLSYASRRRQILHLEVKGRPLRYSEDFVWVMSGENLLPSKFVIDVEFTDLKISTNKVDEKFSPWADDYIIPAAADGAREALNKMFMEGLGSDVTINVMDGSVRAHQAILAVRSPVFRSMFSHDFKEKKLSTVEIPDMSVATCGAFLRYLYGDVDVREFRAHRLPLLQVADKYDVSDLRRLCEESLIEDVDKNNVLQRLQAAHFYRLSELKTACMDYLVEFGRLYDLWDDLTSFRTADKELWDEVCNKVLTSSKELPEVY